MSTRPIGSPIAGRMMTVGHGGVPKSFIPAAVAMITMMKQRIDSPIADAIMKARMRSPRFADIGVLLAGVSFATD
ncbi:MAG: hypothetical protein JWP19_1970 [Rhodoglobus sp.]|nr:hypothetical protein [Rhodoglobus sp.]